MPIEIESPEQMGYQNLQCNLTESSCTDVIFGDLKLDISDLVVCYGDHLGHKGLRADLAKDAGGVLNENNVLITAGAATALFIVSTSLLEAGDELVVMRPNYATNIETPKAIGASIKYLDLKLEEGWKVDFAKLESLITPKTKFVSITVPHNPTGTVMSEADLKRVIALVEKNDCFLLCDETYRDMTFGNPLPVAAALSDRAISVCSFSKTYGLPGIRIGWLMTKNPKLFEKFLAAKEQIMICNSVVDEEIAYRYLKTKNETLPVIKATIAARFEIVKKWMSAQKALEWVEPSGGVVGFPRIKKDSGVDVEKFYQILNGKFGTFVGPGHWFEQDRRYMRIGFGWPKKGELIEGLTSIANALTQAK